MEQFKPSPPVHRNDDFMHDLSKLLNRHSIDNLCETPDFVLARYVADCLTSYNDAVRRRQHLSFAKDFGATFTGTKEGSLELNPEGTAFGVKIKDVEFKDVQPIN